MSPTLTIDPLELEDAAVDDAAFELDLRVVEATGLVMMTCDTSDGCGSTCSTSACSTDSNDPI